MIAYDKDGEVRGKDSKKIDLSGIVEIKNVKRWWPYLMDPEPGYLYTVEVSIMIFFMSVEESYDCPIHDSSH